MLISKKTIVFILPNNRVIREIANLIAKPGDSPSRIVFHNHFGSAASETEEVSYERMMRSQTIAASKNSQNLEYQQRATGANATQSHARGEALVEETKGDQLSQ